ncbi:Adenylate cyclase [Caenispirillum salinarum AK4]|uniref:Adenylate cyclase n=1 Tax=Caenispirillum salinarum AK4 TaxID=1238182 RepID=K9HT70_9PROT|nr:adenylate/guanylate cyclase domain-containing protein [Caenispirillum salinarum]EKV31496.1 Adenylate cyclase [Caenispirillum salinarum AK4]
MATGESRRGRIGGWIRRAARGTVTKGRGWAILLLIALSVLRTLDPAPIEILRVKTFDLYQQIEPREVTQRPVTIVDLDEKSLNQVGQWPWPRTTVAEMVQRLTAMGAVVIGFDIVFAEPDRMSPALVQASMPGLDPEMRERLKSMPSNDEVLAQVISQSRVVMGQSVRADAVPAPEDSPTTSIALIGSDVRDKVEQHAGMLRNIPILDRAAMGRGVFNTTGEIDGIVRRVPMVVNVDGTLHPSLSAEVLRVATGNQSLAVKARGTAGVEGIVIRPNLIRTDHKGRVWVYFSHMDPEKYVSAADVLNGTAPPEKIAGKLVLIGTSAVGLLDIKSSPVDAFLPGVEVHAQILENILTNTQLIRPRDALGQELVAGIAAGLLMIVLVPMVRARWTALLGFVSVAAMFGFSWWAFQSQRLLYDPVYPALVATLLYMYLTYSNYVREEKQKAQVRQAFGQYLSPALVEKLASDPSHLKLGGEMRPMTLMFCDVRGFTTISELFDAEGLTRLINRFLTPMTDVIMARQGTIDKYMGDCIMAFWNAPLDDPEHARNACDSALAMIGNLKGLNEALKREAEEENRRHVPINIGIGLNTGTVCVGNMGSEQRFDYSVLGDDVNLASRLEGQSKTYGVTVVLGEQTARLAPEYAQVELDLIRVKGKTVPVRIFALLGSPDMASSSEWQIFKARHDQFLALYRGQRWNEMTEMGVALRAEAHALGLDLDGLYDLYDGRADDYRAAPPGEDWDGVFVATSK